MKRILGYSFVFLIIALFTSSIYEHVQKSSMYAKAQRLPCHKQFVTFERVYNQEDIKLAQKQVRSGRYKFTSQVEKAVYMESELFEYVNLAKVDSVVNKELKKYFKKKQEGNTELLFDYYIYENDVQDPGKKTEKSKLYAGYVVFNFYNTLEEKIYKVQVDFMDKKGDDIANSIACAFTSLMSI